MPSPSNTEIEPGNFRIQKIAIPLAIRRLLDEDVAAKIFDRFRPRDSFYQLPIGYTYQDSIVDALVEEAREKTKRYKGKDDLDYTGFHQPWNPLYQVFRIHHATEHLIIAQLYENGINPPSNITFAQTISYSPLPIEQRIGIMFDERLAPEEDLEACVQLLSNKLSGVIVRTS